MPLRLEKKCRREILIGLILVIALFVLPVAGQDLDPVNIPKYENVITGPPPVWVPDSVEDDTEYYTITVSQFEQRILPPSTTGCTAPCNTTVWGYGGMVRDVITDGDGESYFLRNAPAASFDIERDTEAQVTWINDLTGEHLFAVDPTLHWADPNGVGMKYCEGTEVMGLMHGTPITCTIPPDPPFPPGYDDYAQSPVPIITHLHGAEVQSTSDGHPEAWYTADGTHGMAYNGGPEGANYATFTYPNEQPATTLWYHDHALGITRINVLSGLAGFYLLRDEASFEGTLEGLVNTTYEVPLVFQDRSFLTDGNFSFYTVGNSPSDHPYWVPEFFGNTIMVNGLVWPMMNVDQGVYRFRMLDGSNARFYTFRFCTNEAVLEGDCNDANVDIIQIGSDGGFLKSAATLTGGNFTIAPGERMDILVDFSALNVDDVVYLRNFGNAPFPDGDPVDEFTSTVMRFNVTDEDGPEMPTIPTCLNPTLCGPFPSLPNPDNTRILVLKEVMNMTAGEPVMVTLNGQKWMADISEKPVLGTTEQWIIVNPTMDAHPIHLHLVQFQLVNRYAMDTDSYDEDWIALQQTTLGCFTAMPPWPDDYTVQELDPFLPEYGVVLGNPLPIPANEVGWKDTIQMYPGQVTIIRARWAPIDGSDEYPFEASVGPGYVWHCHILDHEDNEMMRPYLVLSGSELQVCKTNTTGVPLTGWNFTVDGVTQMTEDVTGCTNFTNLLPGSYTVTEELKPGWTNITPLSQVVDDLPEQAKVTLTFMNALNSSIKVCKENVTKEGSVVGPLEDWEFNLTGKGKDITQTTDETGCTNFTNLVNGTYTIEETLQDLWINVTSLTQEVILPEGTDNTTTFQNRYMDVWCGKEVSFWKTEILKYENENPEQSRTVCDEFFDEVEPTSLDGYSEWMDVYDDLSWGGRNNCQQKAAAQYLALQLSQEYYDDGLKFRIDTSLMSNDDPCKNILKNDACGSKTQCSVESIFGSWLPNCKKAFEIGQCVNSYAYGCSAYPGTICSANPFSTPPTYETIPPASILIE